MKSGIHPEYVECTVRCSCGNTFPAMKSGIHPEYVECTVRCSCGNTFKTHSTKSEIQVELCNECHPFYTGQQKFVDTGGRVQRFADKFGGAAQAALEREAAIRVSKGTKPSVSA